MLRQLMIILYHSGLNIDYDELMIDLIIIIKIIIMFRTEHFTRNLYKYTVSQNVPPFIL